jgi:tetratricopeptide (TPR) repeat protein
LSEIVGLETDYRDAAELLTRAGMALSEFKTQEHLAHLYHDGLSYYENEEWSKAQAHLEQVLESDPDYLDAAALAVKARRRARWSHSPLGRISHNVTHWLRGPSEQGPPDLKVKEPSQSELRKDYGEPTALGQ